MACVDRHEWVPEAPYVVKDAAAPDGHVGPSQADGAAATEALRRVRLWIDGTFQKEEPVDELADTVSMLKRLGVTVVDSGDAAVTHVAASQQEGTAYAWAYATQRPCVTLDWMLACVERRALVDPTSRLLYGPRPATAVPGAGDLVVSLTKYERLDRQLVCHMVEWLGAVFSDSLMPGRTNVLIAAQDVALGKLGVAGNDGHRHAPMVSPSWLAVDARGPRGAIQGGRRQIQCGAQLEH